jgi:hypothetical protein
MAEIIYALCAVTALLCGVLLLRGYARQRHRLLFWSGLCFCGMAVNNVLLIVDRVMLPGIDLSTWRLVSVLASLLPLLYGLVWEEE